MIEAGQLGCTGTLIWGIAILRHASTGQHQAFLLGAGWGHWSLALWQWLAGLV